MAKKKKKAISHPTSSPDEQRLAIEEQTLSELEADLNNDANNYMRSKVEIKVLANQVKKKKQQVNGLRKKVERLKALQLREQQQEKDAEQNNVGGSSADRIAADKVDDDEEEEGCGGGFFDMFGTNNDDEDVGEDDAIANASSNKQSQPQPATTTADDDEETPQKMLDFTIPNTWTGSTPQKKLDEVLKKQKLPRARYTKLPANGGYTLSVTLDNMNQSVQKKWEGQSVNFHKGSSIKDYLATFALYAIDSSLPLYQIFPPNFRELWLIWMNEEKATKDEAQRVVIE